MSKHRLLGATAAAAITMGGLAAAAVPATALPAGTTVVITPSSGLLNTSQTRSTGHNDYLESGLHVWTEGAASSDKAAGYIAEDVPLAGLGEPTLAWTLTDPNLPGIPGQQLVVDFDDDGTPDGTLVGEPVYGGSWWLTGGSAQFAKDGAPHQGGGSGSNWFGTLDEWRTAFPAAEVRSFGYSLGSGVHGDGVISQLTLGDTTYLFALGLGPCAASIDPVDETYTLTADCSTLETITVPDGWTLDGAGYTLTAVEDASHQNFPGAVVQSATGTDAGPATMHVENLDLETSGFENGVNSGGALAGIKFVRAGGSVNDVAINGISHGNGVQEGNALWVRNRDAAGSSEVPPATVTVDHVTITRYQKTGIILDGNLGFTLSNAVIGASAGPTGDPLTVLAANAVQISRSAHGTVSDSHIALNEYNPDPPPGDGSDATGILVYDASDVTLERNVISGADGDVGLDLYNDTSGAVQTHVTASCNLFSRSETQGDYDPYGVGVATYDDGSMPVDVSLSDSSFSGWNYDTSAISYAGSTPVFGKGVQNDPAGDCPPSQPTAVTVSGGDQQTDVSWTGSSAPDYAPLTGYTVTATDADGDLVATQDVPAGTTTAHLDGLPSSGDNTIAVVATSGGGTSDAGTATLHATSLTFITDKARLVSGKHTTLSGVLHSTDGQAQLGGRQVTIQRRAEGSSDPWTTLGTQTVGSDGSFSRSIAPVVNTEYRAVYAGAPDNSSVSASASVDVAFEVTVRVSSTHVSKGDRVLFSGVVSPNHTGFPVSLQIQAGDGTWSTVNASTLDAQSSFGLRYKAKTVGTFHFRVTVDGDATHADGRSRTFTVKVS